MGVAGLVLLLGRCCGSHAGVGARFQMLALDAGGRRVQERSSIRTDTAYGVGFGAG
jgi:hypothetical protein